MVEVIFKPDPERPGFYVIEKLPDNNQNPVLWGVALLPHVWRPPTDVFEVKDTVVVRVEIAGMRETDFNILLDERDLTIHGQRPDISERRAYHQMEIRFGEFVSKVELPYAINAEKIEAIYQAGLLKVTLPKASPQKVPVEG